jgi:hypothetical protein
MEWFEWALVIAALVSGALLLKELQGRTRN